MSFTTSATSATSIRALTTPFVYAPECAIFSTTSLVSSFHWNNYSTTTIEVLVSDLADDRFSSCQPLGWSSGPPESAFVFSPAVCPSGWTAHSVERGHGYTVASCCDTYGFLFLFPILFPILDTRKLIKKKPLLSSGYALSWGIGEIKNVATRACVKVVSATVSSGQISTTDSVPPSRLQVHNAWEIRWAESDRATLSPTPPLLTCSGALISKWVPGQPVEDMICYESRVENHGISPSLGRFLMIGLPIIVLALVASCCLCCIKRHRLEKRIRQEEVRQM
jgi:hypothetical protein